MGQMGRSGKYPNIAHAAMLNVAEIYPSGYIHHNIYYDIRGKLAIF